MFYKHLCSDINSEPAEDRFSRLSFLRPHGHEPDTLHTLHRARSRVCTGHRLAVNPAASRRFHSRCEKLHLTHQLGQTSQFNTKFCDFLREREPVHI